jgi:hypothetical protein
MVCPTSFGIKILSYSIRARASGVHRVYFVGNVKVVPDVRVGVWFSDYGLGLRFQAMPSYYSKLSLIAQNTKHLWMVDAHDLKHLFCLEVG